MKILVLGARGFVGRHVMEAVATARWEPVAGVRRQARRDPAAITLDACDTAALSAALVGIDAVVNCVAGNPETIVRNALALAAAAARTPVHVIHLSSMAVYGAATGLVGEQAELRDDIGGYASAKIAAERAFDGLAGVTILRPGCIYGAGSVQWTRRIARLLIQRRIGDLGVAGDGCANLVHIRDAVAAIVAVVRAGPAAPRIVNLAMPDTPDWNDYFIRFGRAIGAVPVRRVPTWQLTLDVKLLAPPLKIAELIAARLSCPRLAAPPIPPSLARLWRQDIRLDSALATMRLGLVWTSLDEGLAEAAGDCRC